jgi:hypothetical protein
MHRLVTLVFDRVESFDLSTVAEVFKSSPIADRYEFAIATATASPVLPPATATRS